MRTRTLTDYIAVVVIACTLAAMLVPALAVVSRPSADAKCQSNIRRWAQAMALYTADHSGVYPTNRNMIGYSSPASGVLLSLDTQGNITLDANGDPIIFQNGINWVEALYPYLIKRARETGQNWQSFLKCPNAYSVPLNGTSGLVSYAMNFNLVEQFHAAIRNPEKVMMLREMDRLVHSVCRPTNMTVGVSTVPMNAFLGSNATDGATGTPSPPINAMLHGNGSYIVFADGHIHWFDVSYYSAPPARDTTTGQWWNYVYASPANDQQQKLNKSIAITPF